MPIKNEEIKIKWSPSSKKWYENKGYVFTGMKKDFIINSEDISHCSLVKITCICENCNSENTIYPTVYFDKKKNNEKYLCKKCARILNGTPNTAKTILKTRQSFGSWLTSTYGENAIYELWSEENTINPYEISYCGRTKIKIKCKNCGNIKNTTTSMFVYYNFRCPRCSDGISYPNKFMFSVLRQLEVDFIPEYSPTWIGLKKYDFYFKINESGYIIEMDGAFHNRDNPFNKNTKEESKTIDRYKDKLAKENNIKVIRINCDYKYETRFAEIRKEIETNEALCLLFDLSNIDWNICEMEASSNKLKEACDLFMNKNTIKDIMTYTKLSNHTIQLYLKKGSVVGLCNYNPIKESERVTNNRKKKVICLENGIVYDSIGDCQKQINIGRSSLSLHLKGGKSDVHGLHYKFYLNS